MLAIYFRNKVSWNLFNFNIVMSLGERFLTSAAWKFAHTKFFLESAIQPFMAYWRKNWPNKTIPPKMHMLEDHVVDFICEWKVGLGFYGEQGGESIHSEFNRLHHTNSALPNIRRVKYMLQQHYLKSLSQNSTVTIGLGTIPQIKKRGEYNKDKNVK